ncbi:MAG: aminoacyl-tRNA hydrolase [Kofleriaceae bacterium]|nr:aminoacyl-tRNA hydrolase [Kofleriaceae bacterium]MCL4227982.1 aminoacyl-tRNA hydrolase [Myxococcales bacterium]
MWMIVGLGNPGAKYARNRHNIGFQVVEAVARRHGLGELRAGGKLGGHTATGVIVTPRGRQKVVLLEPMEFMNLSGFAVQRALAFYGVGLDELLVVHDEIDLDLGVVRLKQGGGHGGHNGLRSIQAQTGGSAFARVRVGVGKPGPTPGTATGGLDPRAGGGKDVSGWVLGDFPGAQAALVEAIVARAADAVEAVVGLGLAAAMNDFNGKPPVSA